MTFCTWDRHSTTISAGYGPGAPPLTCALLAPYGIVTDHDNHGVFIQQYDAACTVRALGRNGPRSQGGLTRAGVAATSGRVAPRVHEGFSVALVARNAERLAAGVQALQAKGIRAEAFPTDLSQPDAVRALVGKVRTALGPISVLQWTAYSGAAGDLTTASVEEIRTALDLAVTSLIVATQEAAR